MSLLKLSKLISAGSATATASWLSAKAKLVVTNEANSQKQI